MKATVEIESVDSTAVLRLGGDIDMSDISNIEEKVGEEVGNTFVALVVDLTDVTYLDSAGIRLLYHLDMRMRGRNRGMFIVVPSDAPVKRTLDAAGAIASLRVVTSLPEALAAIERG